MTEITDVSIPVKRKRGRPKKFALYADFSDIIVNTFNNYLNDYKSIIDLIISYKNLDERINQKDWNLLYEHVKHINDIIKDVSFNGLKSEYHYRINSQWKSLDQIRENNRINMIEDIYNDPIIEDVVYKSFMIFSHIKLYIIESSKEMIKI
jgi:hypothetical protein